MIRVLDTLKISNKLILLCFYFISDFPSELVYGQNASLTSI